MPTFAQDILNKARDAIGRASEAEQAVTAARSAQATAQKAATKAAHEAGESLDLQARVERERDEAIAELDDLRAPAILDGIHIDVSAERTLARKVDLHVSAAVVAAKRAEAAEYARFATTQALGGANVALQQAEDLLAVAQAQAARTDPTQYGMAMPNAAGWAEDWKRLMTAQPIGGTDE